MEYPRDGEALWVLTPDGEPHLACLRPGPAAQRKLHPLERSLILDNYATQKTAAVERWLRRHPRWQLQFIPTHTSWLNQVERFFARITQERIRRGVFRSSGELHAAIADYFDHHNQDPKPFRGTDSADAILGKVASLCKKLS